MLQEFISDVCEILKINAPKISYDTTKFQTPTTLAQCDSQGKTIFLKEESSLTPDYFFAVAHELRHIWQIKKDEDFYLSNYKTSDLFEDKEDYNLQIAEVDANAFGALIMMSFFSLTPRFDGFSEHLKSIIFERMERLKEQELCSLLPD